MSPELATRFHGHSGPTFVLPVRSMSSPTHWSLPFLQPRTEAPRSRTALIILNQPFSKTLLHRLWHSTDWHCCADGGANRLHDLLSGGGGGGGGGGGDATAPTTTTAIAPDTLTGRIADLLGRFTQQLRRSGRTSEVNDYLPDLLKGDLDSVREDVRRYYETRVSQLVYTFLRQKSSPIRNRGCC
jgi:thiamine pyrophosphokinase